MLFGVVSAGRRALAAAVLVLAGLLAAWVALFRVGIPDVPIAGGKAPPPGVTYDFPGRCAVGTNYCVPVRPEWTIPAAIAIALFGVLLAVLIHRSRGSASDGRAVDLTRAEPAGL
jgi:hypothetical protein